MTSFTTPAPTVAEQRVINGMTYQCRFVGPPPVWDIVSIGIAPGGTETAQETVDRIQAGTPAHDDLKDGLFAGLEATDARAIVNAIQADATALADLLTSIPVGGSLTAIGNPASGAGTNVDFDVGANVGSWDIDFSGLRCTGYSTPTSVYVSTNGGSTWTFVGAITSPPQSDTNGVISSGRATVSIMSPGPYGNKHATVIASGMAPDVYDISTGDFSSYSVNRAAYLAAGSAYRIRVSADAGNLFWDKLKLASVF